MARQVRKGTAWLSRNWSNLVEYIDRANLICCLDITESVGQAAANQRERGSAHSLQQPVQLPAAGNLAREPALSPTLVCAERQLVNAIDRKIVRAIVAGERLIAIPVGRISPEEETAGTPNVPLTSSLSSELIAFENV